MKLTYGIEVQEKDDPFVTLIEHANDNFSIACTPGKSMGRRLIRRLCSHNVYLGLFLVDVFPALRHVPHWFPGAGFKKLARDWAEAFTSMVEVPYAHAKSLIVPLPSLSICTQLLTMSDSRLQEVHRSRFFRLHSRATRS